jgi:23S rRNA (cytidine1920-2'-O)/16S rRNA (cytidine1409-2'-O)-methyltransferase
VERRLFDSRARAQAAVLAGRVRVDGHPARRPADPVAADASLTVDAAPEYASRGGVKLANALDALGVDVRGASAMDLGASAGGFTDCLLSRGAQRVIAVDVGYGQLDWRLRCDPRVHVMERTNARHLTPEAVPWAPDLVTCDLSFIGVGVVWPAVAQTLAPSWRALVMVKPQFELGRALVPAGGVVRDPALRARAVHGVAEVVAAHGGRVLGAADSGLPGPKGNREVFLLAAGGEGAGPPCDLEAEIARAVGHAGP